MGVHIPRGPGGPKVIRPSCLFVCVPFVPYKRKLKKGIKKKKKTSLGLFCSLKLRGNKVFALLIASSKCVDTPTGLGEQLLHVGNNIMT